MNAWWLGATTTIVAALAGGVPHDASALDASLVVSHQKNPTSQAPAPPQTAELADFAWLAGTWQGTWGPRTAEQAWTFPVSGVMSGTMQIMEHGKSFVTELFLLSQGPEGVELKMRHFTATLAPWQGAEPAVLAFGGQTQDGLAFANSADGEPSRLVFKHLDADHYVLRSEVAPGEKNAQITEIVFHRVRQAPPANRKAGF
jgi:hypothetical protein